MSGIAPVAAPSAALYLVQSAERLRLAVKDIQTDIEAIKGKFREVNHALILVLAALQELQDESHNGVQP